MAELVRQGSLGNENRLGQGVGLSWIKKSSSKNSSYVPSKSLIINDKTTFKTDIYWCH